jgi:hypothetical protein
MLFDRPLISAILPVAVLPSDPLQSQFPNSFSYWLLSISSPSSYAETFTRLSFKKCVNNSNAGPSGRLPVEIVVSNPTWGMDVCLL